MRAAEPRGFSAVSALHTSFFPSLFGRHSVARYGKGRDILNTCSVSRDYLLFSKYSLPLLCPQEAGKYCLRSLSLALATWLALANKMLADVLRAEA